MELWEKFGETRKGRVLGGGRQQDPHFLLTGTPMSHSSASSSYPTTHVEEIRSLKDTVATLQENEHALRVELQEKETTLRQELGAQTKDLQEQMTALTRMFLKQAQPQDPSSFT